MDEPRHFRTGDRVEATSATLAHRGVIIAGPAFRSEVGEAPVYAVENTRTGEVRLFRGSGLRLRK